MQLSDFKNTCCGRRCVLIGNGPSLNCLDLTLLEGETIWCFNRGYILFESVSWHPSYYLIMDPLVLRNSVTENRSWISQLSQTIFILPSWVRKEGLIEPKSNIIWFELCSNPFNLDWDLNFGLPLACTVMSVAISLAADMGFSPIILLGCDLSYSIPSAGPTFMAQANTDADHFDSRYLQSAGPWTTPNITGMQEDFAIALKLAEARHVKVINATEGGNLHIFQRQAYASLFAKK